MLRICLIVAHLSKQASLDGGTVAELPTPPWSIDSSSVRRAKTEGGQRYEMRYASGALFAEGVFVWKGAPFARTVGIGRLLYPDGRVLAEVSPQRKARLVPVDVGTWYFADGEAFASVDLDEKGTPRVVLAPRVQALIESEGPASVMKRCPKGTWIMPGGPTWSGLSSEGKLFREMTDPFKLVCANSTGTITEGPHVTLHLNGTVRSAQAAYGGRTTFWYADGTKAATELGDTKRCWRRDGTVVKNCGLEEFLTDHVDWLVLAAPSKTLRAPSMKKGAPGH